MDQDEIEAVLLEYTIKDIKNLIVEYIGAILVPNIDYDTSIQILKEIESQFEESEKMFEDSSETVKELYDGIYACDSDDSDNDMDAYSQHRHKLSIVTLETNECYRCDDKELSIFNYTPQQINSFDRERGYDIEIHRDESSVFDFSKNNKEFLVTMYLHGTNVECDVSFPTFEYIDKFHAWIIMGDFWGAPEGIDSNGKIMLLDFSRYK